MRSLKGWGAVVALVGSLAWGLVPSTAARAEGETVVRPQSLDELARLSWPELERLYRASGPGAIPVGYAAGMPIYCPDARLSAARSKVTHFLWRGKHFSACDGTHSCGATH